MGNSDEADRIAIPPIVTLTMNPALDVSTATARLVSSEKLRCSAPRYDPGGGGVNVARAVRMLGGDATAVFPIGGSIGVWLRQLLNEENVTCRTVTIAGSTRENFHVDERETGQQFRFVMPGPRLSAAEQERCLDEIAANLLKPGYFVMSGSLPPGVPNDFYRRVAERARLLGFKVIFDSSGGALREIGMRNFYLLKPNRRELGELVGRDIVGERHEEEAARDLIRRGRAEFVVVSLGAAGAILADRDGCWRFASVPVPVASNAGAGDSMVAGIVLSLARGALMRDAVRYGMAAGAAALMRPGTELCRRDDTERLAAQIPSPTPCP